MTISYVCFYSVYARIGRRPRKEAFQVRISYSQNVMRSQLYIIFSLRNIGLICLKMFVVAVWISVLVSKDFWSSYEVSFLH